MRDRLHEHLHLAGDALAGVAVDQPEAVHDQVGAGHLALEVLVLADAVQLVRRAGQQEAAAQVAPVRVEEQDVEPLHPALLLHAAEQPDDVVEGLDGLLLAAPNRTPPTYEQAPVGHGPNLPLTARHGAAPVRSILSTPAGASQ